MKGTQKSSELWRAREPLRATKAAVDASYESRLDPFSAPTATLAALRCAGCLIVEFQKTKNWQLIWFGDS